MPTETMRSKGSFEMAIVEQAEIDPVGDAALMRPLVRELVLLFRQRDADDLARRSFREIKPEPAPARADVEDAHAGPDVELGGEVALLGKLRLLERGLRRLEIGAGILPVASRKRS